MKYLAIRAVLTTLTATAVLTAPAIAETYPTQPIKIIVGYGAGSGADTVARVLGDQLGTNLNASVVIENQPGAGGAIGTVAAARAPADGYTLLLAPTTLTVSPHMDKVPKYDAVKDFEPIMRVATLPMVLVAGAQTPFDDWKGLVEAAKNRPGHLNYATSGKGAPSHLEIARAAKLAGIDIRDVPYRTGSQAFTDVAGGEVSFYFPVLPAALQHIESGRIKAIAMGTKMRSEKLPNVPTLGELLGDPNYEATVWYGLLAPKGTPAEVVDKLAAEMKKILDTPAVQDKITNTGSEVAPMDQTEFAAFIKQENTKWRELVRELGLQN